VFKNYKSNIIVGAFGVSPLPTPSCLKYIESVFLAHEKESEVQQGEYFPNNSCMATKQAITSKVLQG
jgi:hypothetical protein